MENKILTSCCNKEANSFLKIIVPFNLLLFLLFTSLLTRNWFTLLYYIHNALMLSIISN